MIAGGLATMQELNVRLVTQLVSLDNEPKICVDYQHVVKSK